MQFTIKLNDDGTFEMPKSEEAALWCEKHRRGIIVAIGDCPDPAWQHVHHMSHADALKAKLLLVATEG